MEKSTFFFVMNVIRGDGQKRMGVIRSCSFIFQGMQAKAQYSISVRKKQMEFPLCCVSGTFAYSF